MAGHAGVAREAFAVARSSVTGSLRPAPREFKRYRAPGCSSGFAYVYTSGGRGVRPFRMGQVPGRIGHIDRHMGTGPTAQGTVYAGRVANAPEVELQLRASTVSGQLAGYEISHSVSGGQNGDYVVGRKPGDGLQRAHERRLRAHGLYGRRAPVGGSVCRCL
jgi:hypothetical protein